MKQIPILFSTPMVQAILDGRKTMTRRIVKPQPPGAQGTFPAKWKFKYWAGSPFKWGEKTDPERFDLVDGIGQIFTPSKNYGKPGDVLWVREKFAVRNCDTSTGRIKVEYAASPGKLEWCPPGPSMRIYMKTYGEGHKFKPSIHMPKSACRIWLEVVSVKVERLQEIKNHDAVAEGIEGRPHSEDPSLWLWKDYSFKDRFAHGSNWNSITSFRTLWQSINGPDSWIANPWVWVIEFKRIPSPHEAGEK